MRRGVQNRVDRDLDERLLGQGDGKSVGVPGTELKGGS